jgi:uncharacterized membrane protein YdjX (TVP38/TMEM64 family)
MGDQLIQLFRDHPQAAFFISLGISVLIAILGVVPSVFVTAANILFFGFWNGLLISLLGEALGAIVAFVLYRKGFKRATTSSLQKYPRLQRLAETRGRQGFMLIIGLRLLPFVPSGLVTFAAAVGSISLPLFAIASTLGKIPALFIEAYSVYQVTEFGWQGKAILGLTAIIILYLVLRKKPRS